MKIKRLRKYSALAALAAIILLGTPGEAAARGGFTDDYHAGWLGFFGGPTFGVDDDPILWRLAIRGGVGGRIGGSPLAIDAGIALDGGFSSETGPFDSKYTSRNIEIVPFARALFLLSRSISLYAGAGLGYVHVTTTVELPILGTTTDNSTGMLLRVMGGVELAVSEEVRVFVEPLGLNSYRFDGGTTDLFSVLIGAGAVF